MHPIEHLRYVARASGADPSLVAREAASALADIAVTDPAGLVPACRRLVERHLTSGPVWWLSARVLGAADPSEAALSAALELEQDQTDRHLAAELPDSSTITVVGWPESTGAGLRRRGDVEVLIVDSLGEGSALARRLANAGSDCEVVSNSGVGPAAAVSDLVVVEALVAGPAGALAAPGSLPAAAVAVHAGRPVWLVTPVGRVLPGGLWDALLSRFDETAGEPWDRPAELVPATLFSVLIGSDGPAPVEQGLAAATCPTAPELLRSAG
ncbi:MAG TPA: hypothetical protein VFV02_14535 [Acidimicrobiales bacterium]|nr:hypothetical protein [Acidimicrobiales bacterium]